MMTLKLKTFQKINHFSFYWIQIDQHLTNPGQFKVFPPKIGDFPPLPTKQGCQ